MCEEEPWYCSCFIAWMCTSGFLLKLNGCQIQMYKKLFLIARCSHFSRHVLFLWRYCPLDSLVNVWWDFRVFDRMSFDGLVEFACLYSTKIAAGSMVVKMWLADNHLLWIGRVVESLQMLNQKVGTFSPGSFFCIPHEVWVLVWTTTPGLLHSQCAFV